MRDVFDDGTKFYSISELKIAYFKSWSSVQLSVLQKLDFTMLKKCDQVLQQSWSHIEFSTLIKWFFAISVKHYFYIYGSSISADKFPPFSCRMYVVRYCWTMRLHLLYELGHSQFPYRTLDIPSFNLFILKALDVFFWSTKCFMKQAVQAVCGLVN